MENPGRSSALISADGETDCTFRLQRRLLQKRCITSDDDPVGLCSSAELGVVEFPTLHSDIARRLRQLCLETEVFEAGFKQLRNRALFFCFSRSLLKFFLR